MAFYHKECRENNIKFFKEIRKNISPYIKLYLRIQFKQEIAMHFTDFSVKNDATGNQLWEKKYKLCD